VSTELRQRTKAVSGDPVRRSPTPKYAMTTHLFDDDNWPPDDPTDEELEALIEDLEAEPGDLPEEPEERPFADVDAEEINRELLRP